jgi:hypothetical protein
MLSGIPLKINTDPERSKKAPMVKPSTPSKRVQMRVRPIYRASIRSVLLGNSRSLEKRLVTNRACVLRINLSKTSSGGFGIGVS